MGVATYVGRALRAVQFKQANTIWAVTGRQTPWADENVPVQPLPTITSILEPVCFVKPQIIKLCKTVTSGGDVQILGQRYAFVDDDDALTESARYIYSLARFDPTIGQPYGDFRQVGLYVNLIPATGYDNDLWLDPLNVADPGVLIYASSDTVTTMSIQRIELVEIIIEFR